MTTDVLIDLNNIKKVFNVGGQELIAVQDLDFQLHPGNVFALTGPSGCGKSTLLNMIGMLMEPTEGDITLLGDNVTHLNERQRSDIRREHMGFIFQSYNLLPVLTAYENVAYPLTLQGETIDKNDERVLSALDNVGLSEFVNQFPDNLSGGQRQRVAIARAMVHAPKVIIADEPTAALDSANATRIIGWLADTCKNTGSALIMATHDDRVLDICDKVLAMRDGRLLK